MECYSVKWGWFFRYNFQPKQYGYFIEDVPPYLAMLMNIRYMGVLKKIQYDELPEHIKKAVAATQSVIIEMNFAHLEKIRNQLGE